MTDAIAAAQGTSHAVRSRLLTLSPDGAVVSTYDSPRIILSGGVTYDRTRQVRRTGTLTLLDQDGDLTPTSAVDAFATGQHLRIERGIAPGAYLSLGTFTVISFEGMMSGALRLRLEDTTYDLRQDFGDAVTISARTRASAALRALWEPVLGDGSDWLLDDDSAAVGGAQTYSDDDERLYVGVQLMTDLGLEVYADRGGSPVLTPASDPTTFAVAHTFEQSAGVATASAVARSSDLRPYNRQVVIGEHPDERVVRGEATITDAAHPHHPDRIGLRTAPIYRSARVATQYQATALARSLLIERAWSDSISWTGIPDITVEAGDIVRVVEPRTRTDARYRIDRVSLPVGPGSMNLSATRIVPLFETGR
jgi:hypothetical protein